jgi:hypothetical protein
MRAPAPHHKCRSGHIGQAEADGEQREQRDELDHVHRQIERLVDAITEGTPDAAVRDRPAAPEERRMTLAAVLAGAIAPAPRLHANLAEIYRQCVAELARVPEVDDATEAQRLIHSLVDAATLLPEGGKLRIEVRGELAAILHMARGGEYTKSAGDDADALAVQINLVAGTGFEPVTFRL